jgi:hypothetical protein
MSEIVDLDNRIRVFIGTDDTQAIATAVLRHSISSRTDAIVEFHELRDLNTGIEHHFYTGFSFYRWAIPSFSNFAGRAIYLDADIVVLTDIAELWTQKMDDYSHRCRSCVPPDVGAYSSVMLIDCAEARNWDFERWCAAASRDRSFYRGVMWCLPGFATSERRGDLPSCFNDLDSYDAGRTKLIHYTDLPNQPWKKAGHPHEEIFREAARAAYRAGALTEGLLCEEVARGHVHQELIEWCTG